MSAVVPRVMHPMVRQWACQKRGLCCGHNWRIDVASHELVAMASVCEAKGAPEKARHLRLANDHQVNGWVSMPKVEGACMFLENDLCGYRMHFDHETLPNPCVTFPYLAMRTPARELIGLSFACPTALDLLARQTSRELIEETSDIAPPTRTVTDFTGEEGSGAAEFFEILSSWYTLFVELEGRPIDRLDALARRASGQEVPAVEVDPGLWATPEPDEDQAQPLLAQGVPPDLILALLEHHEPMGQADDVTPDLEPGVLLGRFLEHRLLVPEFIIHHAGLTRVLGALFAAVVRERIERERGHRPAQAVMAVDGLISHSGWLRSIFAYGDEIECLRSLWIVARAAAV